MNGRHAGIAYFISAHGFGHAVRSCDLIRSFARLYPEIPITLSTGVPDEFIRDRLANASVTLRNETFDVGMVQLDSVQVDVEATLRRVIELERKRADLIEGIAHFLRGSEIGLVVADIPFLPIAAAREAGVPSVVLANFTWDWIYEEFAERDARWRDLVARIAADYACADLLLRLPFHAPMPAFREVEDIPLLAEPGRPRREEIARVTGADSGKTWVLLSFASLRWGREAMERLERMAHVEFFAMAPLDCPGGGVHTVPREVIPFSDLLASVDVVVSKPGFGLLSECVVNRKPLIYVERTNFREYSILESAIRRHLPHRKISAEELYGGDIEGALRDILSAPAHFVPVPAGGGPRAATILRQML